MQTMQIKGFTVLFDDDDTDSITSKSWHVLKNHGKRDQIYIRHTINYVKDGKRTCYSLHMHRMVMNAKPGQMVDHINGNTLDNRKCNLRFATRHENARNQKMLSRNKTGYKGVSWSEFHKKYRAYIAVNGKNIALGMFDDPKNAHEAYCEALKKLKYKNGEPDKSSGFDHVTDAGGYYISKKGKTVKMNSGR